MFSIDVVSSHCGFNESSCAHVLTKEDAISQLNHSVGNLRFLLCKKTDSNSFYQIIIYAVAMSP